MDARSDSLSSNSREGTAPKNLVCKHGSFYLRFVGLWAEDGTEPSRFSKIRGYFGTLAVIGIFVFHLTLWTEHIDGEVIAKFIVEVLAAKTTICKVLTIILNRKNILKIWQKTNQINSTLRKSVIEKEVADKWDLIQCRLIKLLGHSYIGSLFIYLIIPWLNVSKFPMQGAFPQWSKVGLWYYFVSTYYFMNIRNILAIEFFDYFRFYLVYTVTTATMAQEPLKFNIGSTSLSLSYYSQTLNNIYSFFMILKSMVK